MENDLAVMSLWAVAITFQDPTIANIALVTLWGHPTHRTHAISLKGIYRRKFSVGVT